MRLLTATQLCALSLSAQSANVWNFNPAPDEFREDALLDLRWMNERVAGGSGYLRVDDKGDFVLGSGKPVRLWAVNTTVGREKPYVVRPLWRKTEPSLERHARFLAKRGVNMVRLHAHINPDIRATPNAKITDVNPAERDWIWRSVAAFRKEGIYTTVSPYWPNTMQFNPDWNYEGGATQAAHGLIFFDETLQSAYRSWMRSLLAEPNPYTGIPLAKDPALAIIQIQNEDSLLFWTVNNIKGPQLEKLERLFYSWAVRKYGTYDEASRAWGGNRVATDDPQNRRLGLHNLWEMTQVRTGGFARRLDDQLQFYTETMHNFHRMIEEFLRKDLGCGQLVNATNWKSGDTVRLDDAERWTYTANSVLAVNRYYSGVHQGPNNGWAIIKGDSFTSPSILKNPRELPVSLKQVVNRPMMVTESTWVMPMGYAAEAPFLVAAYQSLNGVDAFYWFNTGDDEWTPPQSANGYLQSQMKWTFGNPDMLGTFPAAALMYRMGYVRRGTPVVMEHRSLTDLWQRRTPIIAESPSFDPNRDAGDIAPESSVKTAVNPLAFLVGPVQVAFGSTAADTWVADLSQYIRNGGSVIQSNTGELEMDLERNYCLLNAPKAQGVTGFFAQQRRFGTEAAEIRTGNDYGSILLVSMDDKALRESGRILIQVGTQSRPAEWEEKAKTLTVSNRPVEGFEVVNFGKAPWQVRRADLSITLVNAQVQRGWVLDMSGNVRGEVLLDRADGVVHFRFPEDAMYVVLE